MQAKIQKANRPKYFICNGVCIRIDNIVFAQKMPELCGTAGTCSVMVGISGMQFGTIQIPCKDEIEQTAVYTELTTILAAL